ncbi:MAG: DNA-formamidopyrimidine glycosylase family protein [Planctomycetota bacterium]
MPELPEVERGRRLAESVAAGRRIARVRCADDAIVYQKVSPARFRRALEGRRVVAVRRRGKQLWFEMDAPPHPLFHFGMTGAFVVPGGEHLRLATGPREADPDWPPRFWKIRLEFEDGGELVMTNARRLGRILLRDDPLGSAPISRLGFDPLVAMPEPSDFSRRLRARRGVLKSVLLDQSFCAGVGNWIADEVLYQARIDPRRRACELTDAEARRLGRVLRDVITRAVDANADKDRLPRTWLFHHRWGRDAEARTARGEKIEHLEIGGRTTAWVPAVQR